MKKVLLAVLLHDVSEAPLATMSGLMRPSSHGPQLENAVCTTLAGLTYPPGMSFTAPTVRIFLALPVQLMVS